MTDQLSRIVNLNDRCRLGLDRNARILITASCLAALATDNGTTAEILAQAAVMAAVRRYVFRPEDGPEHNRGELVVRAQVVRFKIDCYDPSLEWGSEDPADATLTTRVMTIMLPEDD